MRIRTFIAGVRVSQNRGIDKSISIMNILLELFVHYRCKDEGKKQNF